MPHILHEYIENWGARYHSLQSIFILILAMVSRARWEQATHSKISAALSKLCVSKIRYVTVRKSLFQLSVVLHDNYMFDVCVCVYE